MPILSVKNLSVALGRSHILHDLSFELNEGENLAVIGPNGSGKTVLVKTLLGQFEYKGEYTWGGNVHIGYVPQKIDADRHLPLCLKDLLNAKREVLHLSGATIESTLKAVGIDRKILATPIGHLSGGQFQKALIAFALFGKPNVLILDEPTASIDQPREEEFYELVHRLQDEYGLTLIIVSHDLSFVYKYATHVLCLISKEKICFGPPTEVLTQKTLAELYGSHRFFHHLHNPNAHH